MIGAVFAALASAFCFALAAALQHREALSTHAAGVADFRLLVRLSRRPLWLLGVGADVLSMALHVLALSMAPLSLVQPLGVTGIVFAVPLAALLRRTAIRPIDLLAAALLVAGLIALLQSLPTSSPARVPSVLMIATVAVVVLALATAATVAAHHLPGRPRALLLAGAAGISFGLTAVLVRALLLLVRISGSAPAVMAAALSIVALGLSGYLLLQSAYRVGHFAGSLATATVLDPVVAVLAGHFLLHEQLPTDAPHLFVVGVATAVVIGSVALLVRSPAALALAPVPAPAGKTADTVR